MPRSFIRVALKSEINTGEMKRCLVDEYPVLVANVGGQFYAMDDTCNHEDASLSKGALKDHCVECPLHGSRFDLRDGHPREEPATEPLHCHEVKIDGDEIFVRLNNA